MSVRNPMATAGEDGVAARETVPKATGAPPGGVDGAKR